MLKKITTTISSNHKAVARKAVVLTGVTLGIVIGLLLNKVDDDPDLVVIEELIPQTSDEDAEWDDSAPTTDEEDSNSN